MKEQIWQLEQKKDADGIIRETPKPYFIEKQAGYRYREPEEITYPSKITDSRRIIKKKNNIRFCIFCTD